MVQTGGGGGPGLPLSGSPTDVLIMLLVLAGVVWLAFRFFNS
jgi:hypothetical protein